jgi:hypothetical protein
MPPGDHTVSREPASADRTRQHHWRPQDLKIIEARLSSLGDRLKSQFDIGGVFLTDYPADLFGGARCAGDQPDTPERCGAVCKWPFTHWGYSPEVAVELYEQGRKLNATLARVAKVKGWTFMYGLTDKFAGHDYCADDPYYVRYVKSFQIQGTRDGAFHPTGAGHSEYQRLLSNAILPTLTVPTLSESACLPAEITSPVDGSVLTGSQHVFKWKTSANCGGYGLKVGKTPGSGEYFNKKNLTGGTVTVTGLPTDGSKVYVVLTTYLKTGLTIGSPFGDDPLVIIPDTIDSAIAKRTGFTNMYRAACGMVATPLCMPATKLPLP